MGIEAIVTLIGGWRACAFLAIAIVLAVIVGVDTNHLDKRQADIAARDVTIGELHAASSANLATIKTLQDANSQWSLDCSPDSDKIKKLIADAVTRDRADWQKNADAKAKRTEVYRDNANARDWGAATVPDAILDSL